MLTLATDVGDADSTRTVWAIIALLVVMGLALVMLAFWVRRTTRPDPEFLAPLELMEQRSWRRGDSVWQRRRLDEVRPAGAKPLERATAPPTIDESFDIGPSGRGFDDLHGDATTDAADRPDDDDETSAPATEREPADDVTPTPIESERPPFDALPDGEFDPSALRRALDELDAELGADRGDR